MTHQKIRRTSGNLERFAAMHDVRISQHVAHEGDYYAVTTNTSMGHDPYLCFQTVSVVPTYVTEALMSDRHNSLYQLAGRFNLWVTIQEEQAAREAFQREQDAQS